MRFIENPDLREWVKDSLCRVVFQKAHELAIQTGCEILIKLENTADQSGQFYATSALNQQYQDQGLSKQPWEVRVCGATGLPEAVLVETGCQSDEMIAFDYQSANQGAIRGKQSRRSEVAQCFPEAMLVETGCQGNEMSAYDRPIANQRAIGGKYSRRSEVAQCHPKPMLVQTRSPGNKMSAYDMPIDNQRAIGGKRSKITEVGQCHTEGMLSSLDESETGTPCAMVDNSIADITNSMVYNWQVLGEVHNTSWPPQAIYVENESASDDHIVSVKVESIEPEIVQPVDCDFIARSMGPFVMPGLPVNKIPVDAVPRVIQDTTDIVPTRINATYPIGVSSNPEAFTQECSPTIDIDQNTASSSTSEITVSADPDTANLVNLKPYQCGTCCKRFGAINKLSVHAMQEHGMAMRTSSSFQCSICGLGFKMAMNLQQHMRKHKVSMPHACKVCQKEFYSLKSLLRHELVHSWIYRCAFCRKVFSHQTNLNAHISRKHGGMVATHSAKPPVVNMERPIPIQKITTDKPSLPVTAPCQSLVEFRSSTTSNSPVIPANQSLSHTRPFSKPSPHRFGCHLCEKSYKSRVTLREHLASHFGIRAHKCKICSASFVRICQLNDHMIHHSKMYPHPCKICGRGFLRPCTLRHHIERRHKYQ